MKAPSLGGSAGGLTVALGVAGGLLYAFFAIASHVLDEGDYGRVVVLWSATFLAISVGFRPIELMLARNIARNGARGASIGGVLRSAGTLAVLVGLVYVLIAIALKGEIEARLFDGEEIYFWCLLSSTMGFGLAYFVRGCLAGLQSFALYSALLVIDAVTRLAFALCVAVGLLEGSDPIALGIAISPGLSALVLLGAVRLSNRVSPSGSTALADPQQAQQVGSGVSFAVALLLVTVSEQVFLNVGPLLANAERGSAAAGAVFNLMMIVRAPAFLFHAVSTTILPRLSSLDASVTDRAADFLGVLGATLKAVVAFTGASVAVVLIAGPDLMDAAFGSGYEYSRVELALMTGGMGLFLVATTLTQAGLAKSLARSTAIAWSVAAALLVAWYAVAPMDLELRVGIGFLFASALLASLLALDLKRAMRDSGRP